MPMPAFAPALRPLDEATCSWTGVAVALEVLGAGVELVSTVGVDEAEEDTLPVTKDVVEDDKAVCAEVMVRLEALGRTEAVELITGAGPFALPPLVLLELTTVLADVVEAAEKLNVLL